MEQSPKQKSKNLMFKLIEFIGIWVVFFALSVFVLSSFWKAYWRALHGTVMPLPMSILNISLTISSITCILLMIKNIFSLKLKVRMGAKIEDNIFNKSI